MLATLSTACRNRTLFSGLFNTMAGYRMKKCSSPITWASGFASLLPLNTPILFDALLRTTGRESLHWRHRGRWKEGSARAPLGAACLRRHIPKDLMEAPVAFLAARRRG